MNANVKTNTVLALTFRNRMSQDFLAFLSGSTDELKISHFTIAPDMALFFNQNVVIFFLFLHENKCCGYLLENASQRHF